MKISELIQELQNVEKQHGNICIAVPGHSDSDWFRSDITVDVFSLKRSESQWCGDLSPYNANESFVVIG